jgi:hypothetical protein
LLIKRYSRSLIHCQTIINTSIVITGQVGLVSLDGLKQLFAFLRTCTHIETYSTIIFENFFCYFFPFGPLVKKPEDRKGRIKFWKILFIIFEVVTSFISSLDIKLNITYKQTVLEVHPSIYRISSHVTMPRLICAQHFIVIYFALVLWLNMFLKKSFLFLLLKLCFIVSLEIVKIGHKQVEGMISKRENTLIRRFFVFLIFYSYL